MDGRFLQGQDQSRACQAHSLGCPGPNGGSFCYGSFELKEVLETGERLAGVVDTTEGETDERSRREREKDYRRYCRENIQRKLGELGIKEDESGASTRKAGTKVKKAGASSNKKEAG